MPLYGRLVDPQIRLRCEGHIRAYADILWRWNLLILRAELLKNSRVWDADKEQIISEHCHCKRMSLCTNTTSLAIASLCRVCGKTAHTGIDTCTVSKSRSESLQPSCTLCRLPVQRKLAHKPLSCLPLLYSARSWSELLTMPSRHACWMLAGITSQVERPMRLRVRLLVYYCRREV